MACRQTARALSTAALRARPGGAAPRAIPAPARGRPGSLSAPRSFSAAVAAAPAVRGGVLAQTAWPVSAEEGLQFDLLLRCLDEQYGLAARYVQSTLAELATILGYVRVASDTVIGFSDVHILMEEVGAPPLSPEELREFAVLHSSEKGCDAPDAGAGEAGLDRTELVQPNLGRARGNSGSKSRPASEAETGVHVSNAQRLFRR